MKHRINFKVGSYNIYLLTFNKLNNKVINYKTIITLSRLTKHKLNIHLNSLNPLIAYQY